MAYVHNVFRTGHYLRYFLFILTNANSNQEKTFAYKDDHIISANIHFICIYSFNVRF